MKVLVAALLAAGGVVLCSMPAQAYTADDTLEAISETSTSSGVGYWRLWNIVDCETAHTFSPNAIGRAGEIGAVQLHPRGELPRFYAYGFDNPWDPYQAVAFLAQRLIEGGARAWTCA